MPGRLPGGPVNDPTVPLPNTIGWDRISFTIIFLMTGKGKMA
jgi:hypothetical protein